MKKKVIIIVFVIFLIGIIIFGMYLTDRIRMKNNKPVLFSTWGYSYVPPINLKEKEIEILKERLFAEIEKQLYAYPIKKKVRLKQLGTFFKGGGFSRENLVENEGHPAILYGDIIYTHS